MIDAKQDNQKHYVLREKRAEVPGVATLFFSDADGTVPSFIPGQYINVYFPELHTPEGKAYSISSAPTTADKNGNPAFSITVRAIGEFSHRLCDLNVGDSVSGSLPYGFFDPEREESDLVCIAAGIGITPIMSMLQHAAQHTSTRRITLMHGVRSMDDAIFHNELATLQKTLPNFNTHYFVSREADAGGEGVTVGRMNAETVLSQLKRGTAGATGQTAEFMLCGSISFVRDMWRDLRDHGIPEDGMYTEAFFSH